MPDDSLEYAEDENNLHTKANRKMLFVGRGRQLASLTPQYNGQFGFCTETENSYIQDKHFISNGTSFSTTPKLGMREIDEEVTTTLTTSGGVTYVSGRKYYRFFTMPSTYLFYIITGIEWDTGVGSPVLVSGVEIVDDVYPTTAKTQLVAVGRVKSAGDTVDRTSIISSKLIKGGTKLGVFVQPATTTGSIGYFETGSSHNETRLETYSAAPLTQDTTAWEASTAEYVINCYYRGYI